MAPPRQLGLDDPKVIERGDRGESDYNAVHTLAPYAGPVTSHTQCGHGDSVIARIRCELEQNMILRSPESHHHFIPRGTLRRIVTADRVLRIIEQLACCRDFSPTRKEELRNRICFGARQCWKLLVVLLVVDEQDKLLDLVDGGASDQCLPIGINTSCCIPNHNHPTINSWPRLVHLEASRWSYAVKAPYFTRPRGGHYHYILDINDVLPISGIEDIPSNAPVPRHRQSENGDDITSGGFGDVERVVLEKSHYRFDELGARGQNVRLGHFALKKLHSNTSRDTFNQELASLRKFQDNDDGKHLIKLLATFEVREKRGPKQISTYYLLFPWAEGDLWKFWREHDSENQRLRRCVWMAEQISHLGQALMHVHNERRRQLKRINDSNDEGRLELFGRHGDIKADNILWFDDDDDRDPRDARGGRLVIADFGLGRLNSKYSRSGVDPKMVDKSATYKAPEFDLRGGKISRLSDIYSLGCTCLEFVTWYLEGWHAVSEDFPDSRIEGDIYGQESDIFFRIENRGAEEKAIIKPKVKDWISRLKGSRHCSNYTLQFLELIEERMLEPDSSRRIKSDELVKELELLADTCRRNSSFYKTPANKLPTRSR